MNAESLERLKALNYPIKLEFDEEDKLFTAEFLDLPGCSASGETVEEAYSRAQEAKEEWLRVTLEQGLPIPKPSTPQEYSGRILVRLPASLHGMLSDRAQLHGASLNQFIVHLLSAAAVADEVSTKIDELRDYVGKLESRLAKLSQSLNQLVSRTAQATSRATTGIVNEQLGTILCQQTGTLQLIAGNVAYASSTGQEVLGESGWTTLNVASGLSSGHYSGLARTK